MSSKPFYSGGFDNPDDAIHIVGISSFINGDRNDVREIERSLVEQDEPRTIHESQNSDILSEFRKRIGAMESTIGMSLTDRVNADKGYDEMDVDDERASVAGSNYDAGGADTASQYGGSSQAAYTHAGAQYGQHGSPRYAQESRYDMMRPQFRDPALNGMSDEQRKQRYLASALAQLNTHPIRDGEKFSMDIEKQNDKKNMLLEQINMLRTNLDDDGIKIGDIQLVTTDNTFEEVESVYKQLRYRNDHARYCGFANEFAQMGAYGLEWAFDGKKTYLGFKPDLTGWSSTLNIKMRRLSYETSALVSDGMREYNMGNFSRLCLELIPSMFLHAKMRSNKAGQTETRPSNNDVSSALTGLRNMDDREKGR